MKKERL